MTSLRYAPATHRARFAALAGIAAFALGLHCVGVISDPIGARPPAVRDAAPPISVASPGPLLVRRLTNAEYDRSVRDLLGQGERVSQDFPADPKVVGFDNNARSLTISPLHAERYRDAAERIAAAVIASPDRYAAVVDCDLSGDERATCLRSFVERFGRRAYRRPLATPEVEALLHVAEIAGDDPDPKMGAALVIESVLQSSSFLFRVELGAPDPAHPGWNRLNSFDLASRLSFLLWGTTPDAALLDRAQAGGLDTPAGLAQTAREMLADPKAREGLAGFYRQWLRLYTLDAVHRDPALYPAWNSELRDAMAGETSRAVDDLIWRDGANFLDLLTARVAYVNAPLAALYGLEAPAGDAWARVEVGDGSARGGLLTHASYLTLTAHSEGSTLIHRGKYVREVLLCESMPSPPPGVPTIPAAVPGESDIERLERHRSDPSCAGCHRRMDPIGTGLRRYDAIGAFHAVDATMRPIAQTGSLYGFDPMGFDGPFELGRRLHDMPEVSQCVVRQVFRYAFGRPEVMTDAGDLPAITQLSERFHTSRNNFRELLVALVTADTFRYGLALEGGSE